MKKIIGLFVAALFVGWAAFAVQAQSTGKITNVQVVPPSEQNTTLTYNGVKIFIPAGTAVLLATQENGSILIKSNNWAGIKIGDALVVSEGSALLSVQPDTQVITLVRGENLTLQDANDRRVALSQGASVSAADVRTSVVSVHTNQNATEFVPDFMAQIETNSTVSEQATQDVEGTLSPSAPR